MSANACGMESKLSFCLSCSSVHFAHPQPRYAYVTISRPTSCSLVIGSRALQISYHGCDFSSQRIKRPPLASKSLDNSELHPMTCIKISLPCQNMRLKLLLPKRGICSKFRWNVGPASWSKRDTAQQEDGDDCSASLISSSYGKKVYTGYSVIGIPGDGRCLFRAVVYGAYLRSGEPSPSESLQRELADELRARVADEFVKRREETEWFVEGDFDTYVSRIRNPYVWGGEPELFMASHVLQMPITVYMHDTDSGGLISIAEYGQEYGKENPIKVLYNGFSHYNALQIPEKKCCSSRL